MDDSIHLTCFGEVLWDQYPNEKKLGGAPLNVAAHFKQLGGEADIISCIGQDSNGSEIRTSIESQNLSTQFIQTHESLATGIVKIELDSNGIPSYKITEPCAWDAIKTNESTIELIVNSNALLFGTLACRNEDSKESLIKLASYSDLNICDLNIRQDYYSKELITELLELTQILKINDEEAELLTQYFDIDKSDLYASLSEKFGLEMIIETKGKEGADIFAYGELISEPALQIEVHDTVGAGDAFLAAFLYHYLLGESITKSLKKACAMGAFVATQAGAIPKHPTN